MGEGEQPASAPQDPSDIPTPKARRPRKKAQPKRNVCLDCGGPIQTLLLPGGGFADGCEICWKENNYKGEPPCNVQKSRYAEKAQKQLDKAQKRKDQKTPAEIQAERLLAARQETLGSIRSKSPLKQALLSLIMHIEERSVVTTEQGLSEIELFHEIDQNGDGILTRGEMATALRRLGCPLSPAELDGVLRASLLKDDLDVTTGKVMGPGKKQGIITIALEKNGDEMTVKASLLHKLTATKGHHHGCLCEACFLECYGTDYFGYAPDDQDRCNA
eukprot:g23056.t1